MRVAIGLLMSSGFPVPTPFVLGLMENVNHIVSGAVNAELTGEKIDALRIITAQGFPIDAARNDVVRQFLDQDGGDWLFFMDADMRHPTSVLPRLLNANKLLISGRYQMRKPPFHTVAMRRTGEGPHAYRQVDDEGGGLVEIDAAGAGALLVHRGVLAEMRRTLGDEWFSYQMASTGLRTVSEDMWFFEQAKACGFKAYVDLDAVCTHVASFEIDPSWQRPWTVAHKAALERLTP